jgi:hypothetical protein
MRGGGTLISGIFRFSLSALLHSYSQEKMGEIGNFFLSQRIALAVFRALTLSIA